MQALSERACVYLFDFQKNNRVFGYFFSDGGEQKSENYLKINPSRMVPALSIDGVLLA